MKDALIGLAWGTVIALYPGYLVFNWVVESRTPVVSAGLLL